MTEEELIESIKTCDFIITNPTHFAVVMKADKQNQCFILLAKGEDEKAQQIKKMALSAQKLVVESPEDARAIFREFNEGDSFDKYNSALIDIMEKNSGLLKPEVFIEFK